MSNLLYEAKEEGKKIADDPKKEGKEIADDVKNNMEDAKNNLKEKYSNAKEEYQNWQECVSDYCKENPFKSIAIALLAGVTLGKIF